MIMKRQEEIDNFAKEHHKDIAVETDYKDTAAFDTEDYDVMRKNFIIWNNKF